jgi:hypothetical protein
MEMNNQKISLIKTKLMMILQMFQMLQMFRMLQMFQMFLTLHKNLKNCNSLRFFLISSSSQIKTNHKQQTIEKIYLQP